MKESKESYPIYIAVDSAKIARCLWCGSGESEEWRQTQYGLYCSLDCYYAKNAGGMINLFCVFTIAIPILLVMLGPMQLSTFVSISILFVVMGFFLIYFGIVNQRRKKSIPKDSRRDEIDSDAALLKALPSEVSCPSCDANIDIRKVSEDRVYACEYCGATGTIEILKTEKT